MKPLLKDVVAGFAFLAMRGVLEVLAKTIKIKPLHVVSTKLTIGMYLKAAKLATWADQGAAEVSKVRSR